MLKFWIINPNRLPASAHAAAAAYYASVAQAATARADAAHAAANEAISEYFDALRVANSNAAAAQIAYTNAILVANDIAVPNAMASPNDNAAPMAPANDYAILDAVVNPNEEVSRIHCVGFLFIFYLITVRSRTTLN